MMRNCVKKWLSVAGIGALLCLGIWCNVAGVRWGLPSDERRALVLPETLHTEDSYRRMASSWNNLFDKEGSIFVTKSVSEVAVSELDAKNAPPYFVFRYPEHAAYYLAMARSYIMRTFEPDMSNIMNSFSQLHPRQLDFFPNNFSYGLVYLGVAGTFLVCSSLLGFFSLQNNLFFYLTHLQDLATLYVSFRLLSIVINGLTAFVVYHIAHLQTSKKSAWVCAGLFLLMPSTVYTSHVVKPHNLGALCVLVFIYFSLKVLWGKGGVGALVSAGIAVACAYGTIFVNGIFFPVFMSVAAWYVFRGERQWTFGERCRKWFYCVLPALVLMGLFSVNIFLYPEIFKSELAHQQHFYAGSVVKQLFSSGAKFLMILANSFHWPFVIAAIAGFFLYVEWRIRFFLFALLGVLYAMLLKFDQTGYGIRFVLPLVPLCLVTGLRAVSVVRKYIGVAGVCLLVCSMCIFPVGKSVTETLAFTYDEGAQATRLAAGRWIHEHIPAGTVIWLPDAISSFTTPAFRYQDYVCVRGNNIAALMGTDDEPRYVVSSSVTTFDPAAVEGATLTRVRSFEKKSFLENLPFFRDKICPFSSPTMSVYSVAPPKNA